MEPAEATKYIRCPGKNCDELIKQGACPNIHVCKSCHTTYCRYCGRAEIGTPARVHSGLGCLASRLYHRPEKGKPNKLNVCWNCIDLSSRKVCKTCNSGMNSFQVEGTTHIPTLFPEITLTRSCQEIRINYQEDEIDQLYVTSDNGKWFLDLGIYTFEVKKSINFNKLEMRSFPGTLTNWYSSIGFDRLDSDGKIYQSRDVLELGNEPRYLGSKFYIYFMFLDKADKIIAISKALVLTKRNRNKTEFPALSFFNQRPITADNSAKRKLERDVSQDEASLKSEDQVNQDKQGENNLVSGSPLEMPNLFTPESWLNLDRVRILEAFEGSQIEEVLDFLATLKPEFVDVFLKGLDSDRGYNYRYFTGIREKCPPTTEVREWARLLRQYDRFVQVKKTKIETQD